MNYAILTSRPDIFLLDCPGEYIYYILPNRLPDLVEETFLHPFQLLEKLGVANYPFETYSIHDDHIEKVRAAARAVRGSYPQRSPLVVAPSDFLLHVMSFIGAGDRLVFVAQAFAEIVMSYPVQAHLSSAWPYLLYCFRLPKGEPVDLYPHIADVVDDYVQHHTGNPWEDSYRFNVSLFEAVRRFVAHQRRIMDNTAGDSD